MPPATDQ